MRLNYAFSASPDIRWLLDYYNKIFPSGRKKMEATIVATENMIMENPYIGRPYKHCDDIRYIALARSPFAFIYRINDNEIEVLRVWDWRKDHAALRLE